MATVRVRFGRSQGRDKDRESERGRDREIERDRERSVTFKLHDL
jgi:hypothetical protein